MNNTIQHHGVKGQRWGVIRRLNRLYSRRFRPAFERARDRKYDRLISKAMTSNKKKYRLALHNRLNSLNYKKRREFISKIEAHKRISDSLRYNGSKRDIGSRVSESILNIVPDTTHIVASGVSRKIGNAILKKLR